MLIWENKVFVALPTFGNNRLTNQVYIIDRQEELVSTENKVAFSRQAYNDSVMQYNTYRESFPQVVIAGPFGFGQAELLESTESAEERKAPKVSFQ